MDKSTKTSEKNPCVRIGALIVSLATIIACIIGTVSCILSGPSYIQSFIDLLNNIRYQSPAAAIKITEFGPGSPLPVRLDETQPNPNDFDDLSSISFPGNNTVRFRIDNLSDRTVSLNNKFPIQLVKYTPVLDEVHLVGEPVGGGSGYYSKFQVDISPEGQEKIFWAEYQEKEGGILATPDVGPDYFTVTQQEPLLLSLDTYFTKPGIYELKIGFSLLESNDVVWVNDSLRILVPGKMIFRDPTGVWYSSCTFKSQVDLQLGTPFHNYNNTYNCVDLNSTQSAPVPTTPVTPIATHSFVTITPASSTNNRPIECTGKIAFNKSQDPVKNEFWTVNPDGSNLNNLKFLDSLDGRPVWSPDGKKIAFTLYNLSKGVYEIALTNDPIAGSDYRVVTSNAIFKGWSPDSKWLAFDRAWDLYIIDNEGKNEKKLFDVPDNQLGSVVSWSPNSKSIVFTYGTENSSGIYGTVLARIDINGLNLQTLASSTFPDIMLEPIWSSNGEYISLLKYRDNCKISGYLNFCNEINIIRPDGTELTQHTNNELWETSISWSPDSQKILFVGMSLESSSGVYIINFDGTGLIQLLKDPDLAIASWSPDGKCISMIINYPTGENEEPSPYPKGDIFIMNNDGSGFTRLTNTGVVSAQWIPNGK